MDKNPEKLGHLPQQDGLAEYLVPVRVTGIKYYRCRASDVVEASKQAAGKVRMDFEYATDRLSGLDVQAMAPELELRPEDRPGWPYWGYGWHGTDGIDWRSYRTDKGPASIPDIAEESWPIPPFSENGRTQA